MPIPVPTSLNQTEIQQLENLKGVTHLRMPAGQVLVYQEHRSPGLFLLLSGRIEVPQERGHARPSPHRAEALPGRPVLLPGPDSIDDAFPSTWAVVDTAEVLYLPRTLVQDSPELKAQLRELTNG